MSKYRIRYIPKKTLILKNLIFYDLHLINDVWFGNKKNKEVLVLGFELIIETHI